MHYNIPSKSPDFLSNLTSFQFADWLCTTFGVCAGGKFLFGLRALDRSKARRDEKKLAALQLTPWENPEKTFTFSAQVGKKHFCSSAHLQMPTTTQRRGGRKEK